MEEDEDRRLIGREMSMAHRFFRREFLLAPEVVRRVDVDDTERAGVVAAHLQLLGTTLHHHHGAEDDIIWPLLHRRAPDALSSHVGAVQDQHDLVSTALTGVEAALSSWTVAPSAAVRDRLAAAVDVLSTATVEHMAYEERHVVPLMEDHVSLPQWGACVAASAAAVEPCDMPVIFGATLYEADEDLVDLTIASMPTDIRLGIKEQAAQAFGDYATLIHDTSTPPRSTELPLHASNTAVR
jgi:hemerythrin HHE cation binding domain-containing protein